MYRLFCQNSLKAVSVSTITYVFKDIVKSAKSEEMPKTGNVYDGTIYNRADIE